MIERCSVIKTTRSDQMPRLFLGCVSSRVLPGVRYLTHAPCEPRPQSMASTLGNGIWAPSQPIFNSASGGSSTCSKINNVSKQLCHPRLTTAQRPSIAFGSTFRSCLSESPVFTTPFGSNKSTPTSSSAFGHFHIIHSVSSSQSTR